MKLNFEVDQIRRSQGRDNMGNQLYRPNHKILEVHKFIFTQKYQN